MKPDAQSDHPRRSQVQRSEATREALLDATIDCLAKEGYSRTTTRRVASLAGMTPGALLHHFPTKSDLMCETMRRVLARFAIEMLEQPPPDASSPQERDGILLDRMWGLHKGPLFQSSVELLVAARTDPALRDALTSIRRERAQLIEKAGPLLYPDLSKRPGFPELVATGQATMRGIALVALASDSDADEDWLQARAHILTLAAGVTPGDPVPQ